MKVEIIQTIRDGKPWQHVPLPQCTGKDPSVVTIQRDKRGPSFLGVGSDVNACTCYNLMQLDETTRRWALALLFSPSEGAGMSVIRDDIGSSDYSISRYSLAPEQGDITLKNFDFTYEDKYTVPAIREILSINPQAFVASSPWSPPAWMKTTDSMVGPAGKLKKKYYGVYAEYLVRYILEMKKRGIDISAITSQNEPRADHGGIKPMPQCVYTPDEERVFVRDFLSPALKKNGLETEIWIFDHNWSMPHYPREMLLDPSLAAAVSGVAWHHYYGNPACMERMRSEFPDKTHHVTEAQPGGFVREGTHWGSSICEALRHGASSYICWVTLLDEQGGPGEGPFIYRRYPDINKTYDVLLWDRSTGQVQVNESVWFAGHIGRYVRRGAVRLGSDEFLSSVTYENPDGSAVLIIENNRRNARDQNFIIQIDRESILTSIPAYSIQTYLMA